MPWAGWRGLRARLHRKGHTEAVELSLKHDIVFFDRPSWDGSLRTPCFALRSQQPKRYALGQRPQSTARAGRRSGDTSSMNMKSCTATQHCRDDLVHIAKRRRM